MTLKIHATLRIVTYPLQLLLAHQENLIKLLTHVQLLLVSLLHRISMEVTSVCTLLDLTLHPSPSLLLLLLLWECQFHHHHLPQGVHTLPHPGIGVAYQHQVAPPSNPASSSSETSIIARLNKLKKFDSLVIEHCLCMYNVHIHVLLVMQFTGIQNKDVLVWPESSLMCSLQRRVVCGGSSFLHVTWCFLVT